MSLAKPLLGWLAFGVVMCLLPAFVSTGTARILIFANFRVIFAMSWDVISGRTGYISFGHPFLIGIAASTTAMLTYHLDTPLWLSIPAGVLATLVGGTLFFLPALRIRGTCFALVTLAFMDLMYQLTQVIAPKVTGGTRGLSGIPTLVSGAIPNYYLTFGLTFAFGILMGEQRPDAGRVFFRGEDVTRMPTRRRVARGIARTCQVPRPFGEMTVLDNIRVGMMPDSVRRLVAERPPEGIDWEIVRNAGFGEREAVMYPGQLSMGELRKLELARTLATEPDVLLLDEVFAGLTRGEIARWSPSAAPSCRARASSSSTSPPSGSRPGSATTSRRPCGG